MNLVMEYQDEDGPLSALEVLLENGIRASYRVDPLTGLLPAHADFSGSAIFVDEKDYARASQLLCEQKHKLKAA